MLRACRTKDASSSSIGIVTVVDTRKLSRDCINESRDCDTLFGEGEGPYGLLLLDSRSFPL